MTPGTQRHGRIDWSKAVEKGGEDWTMAHPWLVEETLNKTSKTQRDLRENTMFIFFQEQGVEEQEVGKQSSDDGLWELYSTTGYGWRESLHESFMDNQKCFYPVFLKKEKCFISHSNITHLHISLFYQPFMYYALTLWK